jgi:hypothetical protein
MEGNLALGQAHLVGANLVPQEWTQSHRKPWVYLNHLVTSYRPHIPAPPQWQSDFNVSFRGNKPRPASGTEWRTCEAACLPQLVMCSIHCRRAGRSLLVLFTVAQAYLFYLFSEPKGGPRPTKQPPSALHMSPGVSRWETSSEGFAQSQHHSHWGHVLGQGASSGPPLVPRLPLAYLDNPSGLCCVH